MKEYVLLDHDGVLVDTEPWYFAAGERALNDIGVVLDREHYLEDMALGLGTWSRARAAGVEEAVIDRLRVARDAYYQDHLRTEAIEIDGVVDALAELARHARLAIVTTAKRADFELIHRHRRITEHVELVLVREDYAHSKPHPEPYSTALARLGAEPAQALVVEDSSRGLRSALAAGVECAVVHHEFTQTQDFTGAHHRVRTLAEVVDIVLDEDRAVGG
jgi:HAD superfamily hydrolase (TIGR01509 family)